MDFNDVSEMPTTRQSRSLFTQAVRVQAPLLMGIAGPTGSGKTLGALRLAAGITGGDWSSVFFINCDPLLNGLGYVDDKVWKIGRYMFHHQEPPHHPARLIETLRAAIDEGAKVAIIDTLSHIWAGRGGVREIHDNMTGNPFANWAKVDPIWNTWIDFLTFDCPIHVLAPIRSTLKYVQEDDAGADRKKSTVKLLGMQPILRPDSEYEFPLLVQLRRDDHRAEIITSRGQMIPPALIGIDNTVELTEDLGENLRNWAETGEAFEANFVRRSAPRLQPQTGGTSQTGGTGGQQNGGPAPAQPLQGAINQTVFWGTVFGWSARKRLTQNEARQFATDLLNENNSDTGVVLKLIAEQWEIPQKEWPVALKSLQPKPAAA